MCIHTDIHLTNRRSPIKISRYLPVFDAVLTLSLEICCFWSNVFLSVTVWFYLKLSIVSGSVWRQWACPPWNWPSPIHPDQAMSTVSAPTGNYAEDQTTSSTTDSAALQRDMSTQHFMGPRACQSSQVTIPHQKQKSLRWMLRVTGVIPGSSTAVL